MAVTADQERVKTLLTETIILLCKNGLHFKNEFTVEGLIGITIDKNDVFLINIKETIRLSSQQLACTPMEEVAYRGQRQNQRKRRHGSRSSSVLNNCESEASDNETPKRNASSDDLGPSKCFSNSVDSPLRASVQSMNASAEVHGTRMDHENSRRDLVGTSLYDSRISNCSNSQKNYQRYDDPDDVSGGDMKGTASPDVTRSDGPAVDRPGEECTSLTREKNLSNSTGECDSNLFPVKVKEELEEVDECQLEASPMFPNCPKLFPSQDGHAIYSGMNYSSVDSSVASFAPAISHQTFQLYHNADQNSSDQQVELLPGSGVYISMRAYIHLNKETWVRGSKLVRRVVREVFPDEHILARSSCLGRRLGGCHVGLDHHKVDTIKAFVQQRMPQVSHTEIVAAINECCRDIRAKLRKSYFRSANNSNSSIKPL